MRRFQSVWVLTALAITVSPAAALGAAGWAKISTDDRSSSDSPSLALAGGSVVAAFARVNSGSADAETDTFTPSADAGALQASIKRQDVVTGWGGVTPWLLGSASAPGGLQVMLSGQKDTSNDPLNGTSFAQRNADGSWAAPVTTGLFGGATSGSAVVAIAGPDNQTPMYVFDYGGGLTIQVGATGRTSSTGVRLSDSQLGGAVQGTGPRLGRDAAGRYWLTWYNSEAPPNEGVFMLQLDPATGQPIGNAEHAPTSSGLNFGDGRFALACAASCRVVYHETDAQGNTLPSLLTWGYGDAAATKVGGVVNPGAELAAAGRPGGGLWIAWYDNSTDAFHAVLTDDNGAGAATQAIGHPSPQGEPVLDTALAAPDGGLVVVTNWLDTTTSTDAFWARVVPGAAPVYSGPTKQTSTKVGTTKLTLVSPKSCVPVGNRIVAKLLVKAVKKRHRAVGKGIVFIKVKSVDFGIDARRKKSDRRKPFKATLVLTGATAGSTHDLYARALLKTHPGQPAIHRTVHAKFRMCG